MRLVFYSYFHNKEALKQTYCNYFKINELYYDYRYIIRILPNNYYKFYYVRDNQKSKKSRDSLTSKSNEMIKIISEEDVRKRASENNGCLFCTEHNYLLKEWKLK